MFNNYACNSCDAAITQDVQNLCNLGDAAPEMGLATGIIISIVSCCIGKIVYPEDHEQLNVEFYNQMQRNEQAAICTVGCAAGVVFALLGSGIGVYCNSLAAMKISELKN